MARRASKPQDLADLVRGDSGCTSDHDRIDDLTLTSSTVQSGSLEEVLLDRALVGLVGLVPLETLCQLVGVIEDVLD